MGGAAEDDETAAMTLYASVFVLKGYYKLVMIGDSCAGKTSLMHKYIYGVPSRPHMDITIGLNVGCRVVDIEPDVLKVKLQIWDTSGPERFRDITRSYCRGAAGCVRRGL